MILKFWSKIQGTWIYKDQIRQVRTGHCRYVPLKDAPEVYDGVSIEVIDGKKLVCCRVEFEMTGPSVKKEHLIGPPMYDVDWAVDIPDLKSSAVMKFVNVDYRSGSGWASGEQMFTFASSTRVFLLSDEGKTIERL